MAQDISAILPSKQNELEALNEKKDLLDREVVAEKFLNIILAQDANVFSINAPWGAGKTFLIDLMGKKARLKHCFSIRN